MDDLISRQAAIDIERNATVDTNPSHFEAHQKFTQFMDDEEVSSFGRWQWSNGFNTALTAVGIDLKKLPSAHPDVPDINVGDMISRQAAIDAVLDRMDIEKYGRNAKPEEIRWALEKLPPAEPRLIRCRDCEFWTKQEASLQGRCALTGTYPTGAFFCGNAKQRPYPCDPEKNTECSKTGCYINGGECRHTLNKEYRREENETD